MAKGMILAAGQGSGDDTPISDGATPAPVALLHTPALCVGYLGGNDIVRFDDVYGLVPA